MAKLITFFFLFCFLTTIAQVVAEVAPPNYIKTIIFKTASESSESFLPIIKKGDYLQLLFDALNGDEEDFYYTIEHYNYDWTSSVLFKQEYLNGIDNQRIRTYENSFNTYQIYSNYRVTIPNNQVKGFKVSGNYMIKIYDNYGDLIFSRKFMVYENASAVEAQVKRSRDVKTIKEKQSVDITITPTINIINPQQTVQVLLIQNNNLNTAITHLKPQYTIGQELIFKYTNESAFWAGNEYFYFENKDIRISNNAVQFTELKDIYHTYLFTNLPRHNQQYTYYPDINGSFVITAIYTDDVRIEADYSWVHFSLKSPKLKAKTIYVYGNYNNYALNEENSMQYNSDKGIYEKSILLKQGFYNYKFVGVNNNTLDEGLISGNFYQTENNYKVLVYYRELGGRYDKIIGMGETSSVNITN